MGAWVVQTSDRFDTPLRVGDRVLVYYSKGRDCFRHGVVTDVGASANVMIAGKSVYCEPIYHVRLHDSDTGQWVEASRVSPSVLQLVVNGCVEAEES